jgi:hypothetical protein
MDASPKDSCIGCDGLNKISYVMDIKIFNKVAELKGRLDYLNLLKRQISASNVYLSYMRYDKDEKNYLNISSDCIRGILKIHDEQIRKMIDEEINKIYKEIGEL